MTTKNKISTKINFFISELILEVKRALQFSYCDVPHDVLFSMIVDLVWALSVFFQFFMHIPLLLKNNTCSLRVNIQYILKNSN